MRKVINFHTWPFRMEKQSNNRGARSTAAKGALLTTPESMRANDKRRHHLTYRRTERSGFHSPLAVSGMFSQHEGSDSLRLQHPFSSNPRNAVIVNGKTSRRSRIESGVFRDTLDP